MVCFIFRSRRGKDWKSSLERIQDRSKVEFNKRKARFGSYSFRTTNSDFLSITALYRPIQTAAFDFRRCLRATTRSTRGKMSKDWRGRNSALCGTMSRGELRFTSTKG